MHTTGWCLMQAVKPIWDPGCILKQLAHAEFNAAMATPLSHPNQAEMQIPGAQAGCNVIEAQHLRHAYHLRR